MTDVARPLALRSFTELGARQRARALLDAGSFRELLDPFAGVQSPWLNDRATCPRPTMGVVVARGLLDGRGARRHRRCLPGGQPWRSQRSEDRRRAGAGRRGQPQRRSDPGPKLSCWKPVARLQEANLGLAAIAEIQAAIVDLQRYQPVVAVIAGPSMVGGMSIAAGLCSYVLVTREARPWIERSAGDRTGGRHR